MWDNTNTITTNTVTINALVQHLQYIGILRPRQNSGIIERCLDCGELLRQETGGAVITVHLLINQGEALGAINERSGVDLVHTILHGSRSRANDGRKQKD